MSDVAITNIVFVGVLLLVYIGEAVYRHYAPKIIASIPQDQRTRMEDILAVARPVVASIEQQAGLLNGAAKKQMAVKLVVGALTSLGLPVNESLVDVAIEAAVYGLKSSQMTASTAKVPVIPAQPQS